MKQAVFALLGIAACFRDEVRVAPPPARPAPAPAKAVAGGCPRSGWPTAKVVDGDYESGFDPTIAWNKQTRSPVVFDIAQEDHPTHWLRFAERAGDRWREPRTLEAGVSGVMAAAVDDHGIVHVAFSRFDSNGPFVGRLDPGWTVDGPAERGLGFLQDRISMLLVGGDVLVAYADHATKTARVATLHAGAWHVETVATGVTLMRDHTFVRDSTGGLHLLASDWSSGDGRIYSRAPNGAWTFVVVGPHVSGISLAIDRTDQLHASWVDWDAKDLRHASGPAGGPFTTDVIAKGNLGNDTSIGVAPDGSVYIAYDDRTCEDLHLAVRRPRNAWTTELVDPSGQSGSDAELVVDDAGCVHVAYAETEAWDIRYATKCF